MLLQKSFNLPEGRIIELSRIAELGISQRGPIGVCLYQRVCQGPPTGTSLQLGIRQREGNCKGRRRIVWSGELSLCGFSILFNMISALALLWPLRYHNKKNKKQKKNPTTAKREGLEKDRAGIFSSK